MGSGNGTAFELAEYQKKNGAAHGKEPPRGKSTLNFTNYPQKSLAESIKLILYRYPNHEFFPNSSCFQ